MTIDEFLWLAKSANLAPLEDLEMFAADRRWRFNRGEPGFGTEATPEDWIGGFQCWRALKELGFE